MFNLEQSIAQWRQQMREAGIKAPARLDELENHLREDMRALRSAGESEAHAFASAVSRLGSVGQLGGEFHKIKTHPIWPVKIAAAVWLCLVLLLAVFLTRGIAAGRFDFLTYTHIVAVTAGYSAALVTGSFGLCFVGLARARCLTPERRQSLRWGVQRSSQLALALVVIGTILALFVSRELFGRYWSWDPKEIGALWVIAWLAALGVMARSRPISDRVVMLMGIAANLVVGFAWFGTNVMNAHPLMPVYGIAAFWPLDGWMMVNLAFLALGLLPDLSDMESPNSGSANK